METSFLFVRSGAIAQVLIFVLPLRPWLFSESTHHLLPYVSTGSQPQDGGMCGFSTQGIRSVCGLGRKIPGCSIPRGA